MKNKKSEISYVDIYFDSCSRCKYEVNMCELCTRKPMVEIHHIAQSFRWERVHKPNNLIWLCSNCHKFVHKKHKKQVRDWLFYLAKVRLWQENPKDIERIWFANKLLLYLSNWNSGFHTYQTKPILHIGAWKREIKKCE